MCRWFFLVICVAAFTFLPYTRYSWQIVTVSDIYKRSRLNLENSTEGEVGKFFWEKRRRRIAVFTSRFFLHEVPSFPYTVWSLLGLMIMFLAFLWLRLRSRSFHTYWARGVLSELACNGPSPCVGYCWREREVCEKWMCSAFPIWSRYRRHRYLDLDIKRHLCVVLWTECGIH